MESKTWLEKRAESKIGKAGFETERLLLNLTETFAKRMDQLNVRRAELAREMGVDRSMVTRILNGDQNVTVKTLVSMASALDCRLDFQLQDLASIRAATTQFINSASTLSTRANESSACWQTYTTIRAELPTVTAHIDLAPAESFVMNQVMLSEPTANLLRRLSALVDTMPTATAQALNNLVHQDDDRAETAA